MDRTVPTLNVAWLCETQGRAHHMIATSKPMPLKGSAEDEDVQPPHRQVRNYYMGVAREADELFKVTMDVGAKTKNSAPKPSR